MSFQTPLVKGLGRQDHYKIGRAALLPGMATGQYASVGPFTLPSPKRKVDLQLRVTFPASAITAGGSASGSTPLLPVILLSHGAGPSNNLNSLNGYLPTSQYYASHGFVVIQPTHLGSNSLPPPAAEEGGLGGTWRSRVDDMKQILDQLDDLETSIPCLHKRLDRDRIVIYGHSMGTQTASMLLGQTMIDHASASVSATSGQEVDLHEPRIKLGLLLGAIGRGGPSLLPHIRERFPFMAEPRFDKIRTPALVIAGDADGCEHLTTVGPEWHRDPYTMSSVPGSALVDMADGKHSFGGVSGWDSTDCKLFDEESPEMCEATLRISLAYLRAKLYGGEDDTAAWREACAALKESGLGKVESR